MPSTTPRIIRLGGAIITIINAGDMMVNMAEEMAVPQSERRHLYGLTLEGSQRFPSQCVHITLSDASIQVDVNNYALAISLAPSYLPPTCSPPPAVVEQLLSQGIQPEAITHAAITHAHFDHYTGTTTERDGSFSPLFPNARAFLGRADWDHADTQEALRDPHSLESHTLGVLKKWGLLELVDGNLDLTPLGAHPRCSR
jgi:hypothetical protein